jgi:hypothetical protein
MNTDSHRLKDNFFAFSEANNFKKPVFFCVLFYLMVSYVVIYVFLGHGFNGFSRIERKLFLFLAKLIILIYPCSSVLIRVLIYLTLNHSYPPILLAG